VLPDAQVHPSLVINMDQTGMHLVPGDTRTYEAKGSKEVRMIGADDKRQITACIASSLDGDLLPLQLIFEGKTVACHPPLTPAAAEAFFHLTHSESHCSTQETMQQYVNEVIVPYAERKAMEHNLPADSHIVLVLDVWSVHKSELFRRFLRERHPRIHLVFVPPNCTSHLQVADVVLQRPFKHGLRKRFNEWAATTIKEQIETGAVEGLNLKMSSIKPLILQWCLESWRKIKEGHLYIQAGWDICCVSLFNVFDPVKRVQVLEQVARGEMQGTWAPGPSKEGAEFEDEGESDPWEEEEDEKADELDIMKLVRKGLRQSSRKRSQTQLSSYMLNTQQIALSDDSD